MTSWQGVFLESIANELKSIREILEKQSTTEKSSMVGEWIMREDWDGDNYYDCSVCGESFVFIDGTPSMNLYHYCPHCGAYMR